MDGDKDEDAGTDWPEGPEAAYNMDIQGMSDDDNQSIIISTSKDTPETGNISPCECRNHDITFILILTLTKLHLARIRDHPHTHHQVRIPILLVTSNKSEVICRFLQKLRMWSS